MLSTKIQFTAALLLATPLVAQSTLPEGFETTEGASQLSVLGAAANSRHQIVYTALKGGGAKTLNEMSFRRDGSQASSVAVGRSWSNVRIQIAEADVATISTTFSSNFGTTPVTVFSGSVTWDDATASPGSAPMPWNTGGLGFKFSTPFNYTGNGDLLIDVQFSGGTLANSGNWTNTLAYRLDAESSVTVASGSGRSLGNFPATHPCVVDTASISPFGPWILALVSTSGRKTPDPAQANQFLLTRAIAFGTPNTSFLTVLSAGGTTSLVPSPQFPAVFGPTCQHLMVDTNQILRIETQVSDATGRLSLPEERIPFDASAVGKTLYTQGIWEDTVTKQPKLTRGGSSVIPAQPADPKFIAVGLHDFPGATVRVSGNSIPTILWK